MKKTLLTSLFGMCLCTTVCAADLIDVYHQALENDPSFKAAYSKFMSDSEAVPQALSTLLPQLTLGALAGRNQQEVTAGNIIVNQTYDGSQWRVSASQAIFNYQAWSQVQQAKASVRASMATFNSAAQDLILRTASAYFNVLLAQDTLNYSEAKLRANKRQLDQAQQRFNVGVGTLTSVYEAQSASDQSIADVISSKNNLINQNENLSKLTNHMYDNLSSLRNSTLPLITPEPNNVDAWVAAGIKQNYQLYAAKYNLEAARDDIKIQSSGNWPIFSVQGSTVNTNYSVNSARQRILGVNPSAPLTVSTAANEVSSFFVPSRQSISAVTINMDFPLVQGGLVQSKTRQAQYDFQTSSETFEKTYRDVVANSHIAFNTIMAGISKVKADKQTIRSQQNSLESVEAQYGVGTRTMTDVVMAQQHLFEAEEQLATDQYNLINSILNLKYLSGSLNVTDLEEINAWLATTRIGGLPPKTL